MSKIEREFMLNVDEEILRAKGASLKALQELDKKTQLDISSFYDVYASSKKFSKKKKIYKISNSKI